MPIPTKPSQDTFDSYVRRIVETYRRATPDQEARGLAWYPVAHDIAKTIASGDAVTGAGVIAVLSAQKSWDQNVRLATHACTTGTPTGHVRANLAKVERILNGESPETVLPMTLKTGHFYRCIADPTNTESVVIDRHAHDVAVGERYGNRDRGLSTQSRYDMLARAYRVAAEQIGKLPLQVQSVTWVVQIESR